MTMRWIRVPELLPLTPYTVYEHTPAYSYKEYPRYINRPGWQVPLIKWELADVGDDVPLMEETK